MAKSNSTQIPTQKSLLAKWNVFGFEVQKCQWTEKIKIKLITK